MKSKDFVIQLKAMMDQHIILIKNSSSLLVINLDLMKENDELRNKIKELEKNE